MAWHPTAQFVWLIIFNHWQNDSYVNGQQQPFSFTIFLLYTIIPKMTKNRILALTLLAASPYALAQYANVGGSYSAPIGVSLQVIVLDSQKGDVAATTTVVQGACSGTVAGLGKVAGRKMMFTPFTKEENGDACVITVEFDKSFKRAKIKGDSCMVYSGAACGWESATITKEK